jgi:hypothetical protein
MAARRVALVLGVALTLFLPVPSEAQTAGRTVSFAGSNWAVKASAGVVGPGPNYFSDWTLASSVGRLDPNVVLGLFTWSDDAAYNHREIDIEVARWGDTAGAANAQYVVQPWDGSGNLRQFVQPDAAPTTQEFTWTQKSVTFRSATASGQTISSWTYKGRDVPRAGNERTRMNLWLNGGAPPADGAEVEVVLSGFTFARR